MLQGREGRTKDPHGMRARWVEPANAECVRVVCVQTEIRESESGSWLVREPRAQGKLQTRRGEDARRARVATFVTQPHAHGMEERGRP